MQKISSRILLLLSVGSLILSLAIVSVFGITHPISQQVILGAVQGVTEWLPVSSEGAIVLLKTNVFHEQNVLNILIKEALFLHMGTFLAALVYFKRDVISLAKIALRKTSDSEMKHVFNFLFISTLISGTLAIVILHFIGTLGNKVDATGRAVTASVGIFLFGTGYMLLKSRERGLKNPKNLSLLDGIILGLAQGLSVLPGISRSGITVSSLLLRKFDKTTALRLSFLMSLPIVLAGNILLNVTSLELSASAMLGVAFSFIFGILSIHLLIKLSEKINFGYFAILFAILVIVSVFV